MVQKYTTEEREVHLWIDDTDRTWKAESTIPKYIRAFQRAGWTQVRSDVNDDGVEVFAEFTAPGHSISIRKAEKTKRALTDEQRADMASRLLSSRKSLKNT